MLALAPQILFGLGEEGGEPIFATSSKASGSLGFPASSSFNIQGSPNAHPELLHPRIFACSDDLTLRHPERRRRRRILARAAPATHPHVTLGKWRQQAG